MVGLGLFLDQCVLHVQTHQNNTKNEKSPKKIFFLIFDPKGGPLEKNGKIYENKFFEKKFLLTLIHHINMLFDASACIERISQGIIPIRPL